MIHIPQAVLRDCHAVFRRAGPKSTVAQSATNVHIIGGRDGVRLRVMLPDIAVEYHHPTPSGSLSINLPMTALAECDGRGSGTVELQPQKNGHVEIHWEQSGVPYQRDFPSREASRTPFPVWPAREVANDPSFLAAMDAGMQIPSGGAGRLSLAHIQLRGNHGDVVATDGQQLLIQGGFQFPWKDALLVPRTPIFAAKELPKGSVVRVAQGKTHVHFRIGGWTIALAIDSSTRFPNVEAIIPKAANAMTRWHIDAEEAPALAAMLDNLPAAKEEHAPITVDLGRMVAIRARAEGEKRCTEVMLPRSRTEGNVSRIVTDRQFLQKALEYGFRSFRITAPDKPILCQDGDRLYVWVLQDPKAALAPQTNALRVMLPAVAGKSRRTAAACEPCKRQVVTAPARRASSRGPLRVFDGFVNCARSLWHLVREHRQQERVK